MSLQQKNTKTFVLAAMIISLLITLYVGYDMYQINQEGGLWLRRPFFFIFFGYWFLVLLRSLWRKDYNWKRLGLTTLSGVLMGVSFPAILPWPILIFVSWVPLLWVIHEIYNDDSKKKNKQVFTNAFHSLFLYNVIATWWVANSALIAGIFANVANVLLMTIPVLLYFLSIKRLPRLAWAAFITFWLSFEYIHFNWDLSWPWLAFGNTFAQVPTWVQWYEFTGVFGGSLWVLLANVLAYQIWAQKKETGNWPKIKLLKWAALLLVPVIISTVRYYTYTEKGDTINVVVVQPNYEPHHEKFSTSTNAQLTRYIKLSAALLDQDVDYLVFPETSFPTYIEDSDLDTHPVIVQLKNLIEPYPQLSLITGLNVFHKFEEGEPLSDNARKLRNGNGWYETYNAAIELTNTTDEIPMHKKSKLVPGPEIFPFKKIFFFMKPLVEKLDGTTAGLATETQPVIFKNGNASIVPVICYESVYGDFLSKYFRQGANAAFIMTNDGWWDDTPGYRQHLYFASLRAIESRRAFARSANTGSSAFINQRGDIISPTEYNATLSIKGDIHLNNEYTFYTKWGDMIGRIAALTALLLLLNLIVKRFVKEEE